MRHCRLWVVGFGTVGQWLVRALNENADRLRDRSELAFSVVGLANRRDGFVHREDGLDTESALALAAAGGSLRELPGATRWPTAIQGMRATDADLLVEVSASPPPSGEPGTSHLEEALGRGISAVTSNKWPVALHGVRLSELARSHSAVLRAESTVMSGTPVLSTLTEGVGGASPIAVRGVLNATANFILSEWAGGASYTDALAEAKRRGLAEPDPSADVDGHDAVAKVMVLAALVFGRELAIADVGRRGISSLNEEDVAKARSIGLRIRELATLEFAAPDGSLVEARVEPVALPADDPLARVEGTDNAIVLRGKPLGEVTVIGPGAGPALAGQGVLSDLLSLARQQRPQ